MSRYNGNTTFYRRAAQNRLSIKDIFSGVMKKHNPGDGARQFMAGTPLSTPGAGEMLQSWQKPWLFSRVLMVGVPFLAIFYFIATATSAKPDISMAVLSMFGAALVPITLLVFFWEMNIPRNIPIYEVIAMFFIGGALSALFAMFIFPYIPDIDQKPWLAPLAEEPAKLLAVIAFLFVKKGTNRRSYIFNGVLIGAAVGAGFEVFETAGYVLEQVRVITTVAQMQLPPDQILGAYNEAVKSGMQLLMYRCLPNAHQMWAALYGGALVWAVGNDKLQPKHFVDPRFLGFFFATFALHAANNSSEVIEQIYNIVKNVEWTIWTLLILLTVGAWALMIVLLRKAVQQVLQIAGAAPYIPAAPVAVPTSEPYAPAGQYAPAGTFTPAAPRTATLICVSGEFAGQSIPLSGNALVIGRDPAVCNLLFSANTPGVSRRHCTVYFSGTQMVVTDNGSSQGTFMGSGQRLTPNVATAFQSGQRFYLATVNAMFEVRF